MKRVEEIEKLPVELEAANSSSATLPLSVSSSALMINSTQRRSTSDIAKKLLEGYGITNKDMQKTFLSLREENKIVTLGLSCVDILDPQAMKNKCDDIIAAVTAMRPADLERNINVLLPVQLMTRHGLRHIDKNRHLSLITTRLKTWATVLGLEEQALLPLIYGNGITVKKGDTTLSFTAWANDYLPNELETTIDELKGKVTDLLASRAGKKNQFTRENFELTALLSPVMVQFMKTVNLPLTEHLISQITHGIVFHTFLAIAHRHPSLASFAEQLSPTNKDKDSQHQPNTAEIGVEMFKTLCKVRTAEDVADEFAHGIAYLMEEICSPAILKQLSNPDHVMIYIPVKEQIRRTNPLRIIAEKLKPEKSVANIEPCNNYESREAREEKSISEKLNTQSKKTASPEEENHLFLTSVAIAAEAAKRGYLKKGDGTIDNDKLSKVFATVEATFLPSGPRSDRSTSSASSSSPRNLSPGSRSSDEEKDQTVSKRPSNHAKVG